MGRNSPQQHGLELTKALQLSFLIAVFLSGCSALIYEVVWVRQLTLIFGHTTFAVSTVLAVFMGGLSLGNFFSRAVLKSAFHKNLQFKCYAVLELFIAVFGFLSKPLLGVLNHVSLHASSGLFSFWMETVLILGASVFILIVPTFLIGLTFPLMISIIENEKLSLVYGINTLGAVLGVALSGFWLIPTLGLLGTFLAAVLCNGAAAIIAYSLSRQKISLSRSLPPVPSLTAIDKKIALGLFLSGVGSLICEVAWTRSFVLILGSSTYTFTTMLFIYLIGIALGSLMYPKIRPWIPSSLFSFGLLSVLAAVCLFIFIPLYDYLPYLYIKIFPLHNPSPYYFGLINLLFCSMIMLLPTFVLGVQMPHALSLSESSGFLYAMNTIGSIVGSVLAGLVLLPIFGLQLTLQLGGAMLLVGAILMILMSSYKEARQRWSIAGFLVVIFSINVGLQPPWDKHVLSSGTFLYAPDYFNINTYKSFLDDVRKNRMLYYKDGVSSSVAVLDHPFGVRFLRNNGKTDASTGLDMTTQLLAAHLPALFHKGQHRDAMVIGFGSGATAGVLSLYPDIDRLDCIEIEPAVFDAAPYFSQINFDVIRDPRFQVYLTDARRFLTVSNQMYDVIVSEPSNPWIAGVANLYTKEGFGLVKKRLKKNGIFAQWFHSYSMSLDDFKMVLNTYASVFPYVELYTATDRDFFLIGSNDPWSVDFDHIDSVMKTNVNVRSNLGAVQLGNPFALLASTYMMSNDQLRQFSKGAPIHSDERPTLEFSAPRYLHKSQDKLIAKEIAQYRNNIFPPGILEQKASSKEWGVRYNAVGEAFMRQQNLPLAEFAFAKAMEYDATARSWSNQGRLFNLKNQELQAEKAFKKSIALDPSYAVAWFQLGMLYLEQGLEPSGLHMLEEGLKRAPADPMGSFQVAQIYAKNKRFSDARRLITAALAKPIANRDLYRGLSVLLDQIPQ